MYTYNIYVDKYPFYTLFIYTRWLGKNYCLIFENEILVYNVHMYKSYNVTLFVITVSAGATIVYVYVNYRVIYVGDA